MTIFLNLQAWKVRRVELIDNGDKTAELRLYKDEDLVQVIPLENIKEVRDVASKTHVHAFEVVGSNGKAIIILSGETALESRDWIWAIRKIFWPVHAEVQENGTKGTGLLLLKN